MKLPRISKNSVFLTMIILTCVAAGYFLIFDGDSLAPTAPSSPHFVGEPRTALPPSEDGLHPTQPDAAGSLPSGPIGRATEDDELPPLEMPDSGVVRQEAADNVHMTPRALLELAHRLAGLMEQAMDSEQAAGPVFTQLEDCATDTQGRQVVQARLVCFANASRLSKQWPDSIGPRFKVLSGRAPNLAGMLEATGL